MVDFAALTSSSDALLLKSVEFAMVLGGAVLLVAALRLARRLDRRKGSRRLAAWNLSLVLVRLFLLSYVSFLVFLLIQPLQGVFVMISAVFLCGGIFVWLVIKASVEAVDEVSLLFENAPDAILLIDVDHNTLINVNENACHLTGHSREALIGAAPDLLRPPGAAGLPEPSLAKEWSRHLASGEPPRFDWAYRTSSGEVVPCEVHLSQLVDTGRNMLRVSIIDISARRQAELVLRLSEDKFSRVFHGSPDYITITRLADGTLFDANEGFERVSGWSPEEAIGRTSLELGIWGNPAERDEMRRIIERDGSIHDFEFTLTRKDGQTRICLLSASTITVSNEQLLVAIIRDINDLKSAQRQLETMNEELERRVVERTTALTSTNEQLRHTLATLEHAQDELVRSEKLTSLGAMVAGVAHELNTPLGNSVMVASTFADKTHRFAKQLAEGNIKRSTLDNYVAHATEAADMLSQNLHLAADLIGHFKQLAVDQTSSQRRKFELAQVVEDVLLALRPQFRKLPHQVVPDIAPGLMLDSFPGPLGQVLSNLISNALIHGLASTPAGIITIKAWEGEDQQINLEVSDNGAGIPREHRGKVFDPFFTTRLGSGGSGLGLHLVYSIVTRVLGGRIHFTSETGQGTRFIIRLPRQAPQAPVEPILTTET
jgi:PAS domain S-box-containing protein